MSDSDSDRGRIRFGDFVLDLEREALLGPNGELWLRPKAFAVLAYLVRHAGRLVARNELLDAAWGRQIVTEDSLTQCLVEIRRALGDEGRRLVRTVPRRGYIFEAPVTPIRVPSADAGDAAEPTLAKAGQPQRSWAQRKPVIVAMLVMTVLVAWWALTPDRPESGASSEPALPANSVGGSVEVNRFEALAADTGVQQLASGVDDALLRALSASRIQAVSSAVAGGLGPGAEFTIAGSVDRQNGSHFVTARIEEPAKKLSLWSGRFEGSAEEHVMLQNQVAAGVAGILQCGLHYRAPHAGQMTMPVFRLFLEACSRIVDYDAVKLHDVAGRIVAQAPELAQGYALLATTNALMAMRYAVSEAESEEFRRAAMGAVAQALKLDAGTGEAYYSLALAIPFEPKFWVQRETLLRKALELRPDYPYSRRELLWLARAAGRIDEAIKWSRRAIALDPHKPSHMAILAWLLANRGALAQADAELARLEAFWPHSEVLVNYRFQIALWYRPPEVAEAMLKDGASLPQFVTGSDIACYRAHLQARRQWNSRTMAAMLSACRDVPPHPARRRCPGVALCPSAAYLMRVYASMGELDAAYREAARMIFDWRGSDIFFLPQLREFRRDPRFMPLAARVGLAEYWLTADRWPDFCAEPDLPYECKSAARAALARALEASAK